MLNVLIAVGIVFTVLTLCYSAGCFERRRDGDGTDERVIGIPTVSTESQQSSGSSAREPLGQEQTSLVRST